MDKIKSSLPWYINNTLSDNERDTAEKWVQRDSSARDYFESIQLISEVSKNQEAQTPSAQLRARLLSEIKNQPVSSTHNLHPWAWGAPVMLFVFLFLWLIIQPGTQLHWSTSGTTPSTIRIFRAPADSTQFVLIEELTISPDQHSYQYQDFLRMPGRDYLYLIEISDPLGNTSFSQAATTDSLMILSTQIMIFLTSLVLAIGVIMIAQEIQSMPQSKLTT